jgi:membrane dipeptidase
VISPELIERAEALHRAHPVVECHSDIPVDVYRRRRAGEPAPLCRDYAKRLRAGGVRFEFMTVGGDVPSVHDAEGRPNLRALQTIDDVIAEVERCPELRIVESESDLDRTVEADAIGLVLHFEGLKPLVGKTSMVKHFWRLGLRSAQLTWNGKNELADGVGVISPGRLSPMGREIVAELDRLRILIDVAHLSEPCFWDVVEVARGPICASHANARVLCAHPRNLTDDQIRAIAQSGGYAGVCFLSAFIGEEATLDRLLDHVDHAVELVGVDAVGVGPDYVEFARDLLAAGDSQGIDYGDLEFPEGLRRVETLPVFTAGLLGRGYSEEDAAKILGGNALRVLREVLPNSM